MFRLYLLFLSILSHIGTFAQRGKIRPEWDIDGGNAVSHHHGNDDVDIWLSVVFLIVISVILFLSSNNDKKH